MDKDIIALRLKSKRTMPGDSDTSDFIAQAIKSRGSARAGKEQPNLPTIVNTRDPVSRQVYQVGVGGLSTEGLPTRYMGDNPGFSDIEYLIKDVNSAQRELDKLQRMGNSQLYRTWVASIDVLRGAFGRRRAHSSVHELFLRQQQNIEDLNHVLVYMVAHFEADAQKTRAALDNVIDKNETEHSERASYDGKIVPEVERYNAAVQKLEALSRDDSGYFAALREFRDAKRETRKLGYQRRVVILSDEHHSKDIENLLLQEELFESVLFRVGEMAYITSLYQDTLDNNERVWVAVTNLAQAVRSVGDGVLVLSDFNRQLNESYMGGIQEINQIVSSHPGAGLIDSTNAHLRKLVHDVHAGIYQSQLRYEPPKQLGAAAKNGTSG